MFATSDSGTLRLDDHKIASFASYFEIAEDLSRQLEKVLMSDGISPDARAAVAGPGLDQPDRYNQ
jgi:hypothetical protein